MSHNIQQRGDPLQLCIACSHCGEVRTMTAARDSPLFKIRSLIPLQHKKGDRELHCALTSEGKLFKFGYFCNCRNPSREISSELPLQIPMKEPVLDVACGKIHTALLVAGRRSPTLMVFGDNSYGQLGFDDVIYQKTPRILHRLHKIPVRVFAGPRHTGVKTALGGLIMWGGVERRLDIPEMRVLDIEAWGGNALRCVAFGEEYFVACNGAGTVYEWGSMCAAQPFMYDPVRITGLQNVDVISVSCGVSAASALTRRGYIYRWGVGINPDRRETDFEPHPKYMQEQLISCDMLESACKGFTALLPGICYNNIPHDDNHPRQRKHRKYVDIRSDGVAAISTSLRLHIPVPDKLKDRMRNTSPAATGKMTEWISLRTIRCWCKDMQSMIGLSSPLENQAILPDTTLIWGKHTFQVHRSILCKRWKLFKNHLLDQMETELKKHNVNEITNGDALIAKNIFASIPTTVNITETRSEDVVPSKQVCQALLRYFYSGILTPQLDDKGSYVTYKKTNSLVSLYDEISTCYDTWCSGSCAYLEDMINPDKADACIQKLHVTSCKMASASISSLIPDISHYTTLSTNNAESDEFDQELDQELQDFASDTSSESSSMVDTNELLYNNFGFGGFGDDSWFLDDSKSVLTEQSMMSRDSNINNSKSNSNSDWSSDETGDKIDTELYNSTAISCSNKISKPETNITKHRRRITAKERRLMKKTRARGKSFRSVEKHLKETRINEANKVLELKQMNKRALLLSYALSGDLDDIHISCENEEEGTSVSNLHCAFLATRLPVLFNNFKFQLEKSEKSKESLSNGFHENNCDSVGSKNIANNILLSGLVLPPTAVQGLINYTYTASVGPSLHYEAAVALLVASDQYRIQDLHQLVQIFIMEHCVTRENAVHVKKLAKSTSSNILHRFVELVAINSYAEASSVEYSNINVYNTKAKIRKAHSPPLTPRRGAKAFTRALHVKLGRVTLDDL